MLPNSTKTQEDIEIFMFVLVKEWWNDYQKLVSKINEEYENLNLIEHKYLLMAYRLDFQLKLLEKVRLRS